LDQLAKHVGLRSFCLEVVVIVVVIVIIMNKYYYSAIQLNSDRETCAGVYRQVWYWEPSVVTAVCLTGILVSVIDFAVPTLNSYIFTSSQWCAY